MTVNKRAQESHTNRSKIIYWLGLLIQSKTGFFGAIIIIIILITALGADFIAPYDPNQQNYEAILRPPFWMEGGSKEFILGTDNLGRDLLSRVIYGSQVSLVVGVVAVIIAGILGLIAGVTAGYFGKLIDNLLMRLVDTFLALPNILLALVILRLTGPSLFALIIVLGITNWIVYARVIRSEVVSLREREYVKAAKSIGVSHFKIMFKHLIPNVMSSFIIISTLTIGATILTEASLSFLGLGVQPPVISWGEMLSTGRDYLADSWWLATFPGLAITITTLGVILLGDWLRDVLDPRSNIS